MKNHIYISILGIALYAFHESDFGEGRFCDGKSGNYRDPENCGRFRTCTPGHSLDGIIQYCPAGLYFNGNVCDWPYNVKCKVNNKGDGGYSLWSAFGPCSKTCGGGFKRRRRACTNPPPKHGGKDCSTIGQPEERRRCNLGACSRDGGYSPWSAFGVCSKTCDTGFRTRTRTCTNPAPSPNGKNCLGLPEEIQTCNMGECSLLPKTSVLQCGTQSSSRRVRRFVPQIGKIVGGSDASAVRRLWQAGLYYRGRIACGGTLIAPDLVLTAASCVPPKRRRFLERWSVKVGDHQRSREEGSEQKLYVDTIIVHENIRKNNIAILKLKTKAILNEKVGIVCLPEANSEVAEDATCYITGWGSTVSGAGKKTSSDVLQEAELPVLSKEKCNVQNDGYVTDNMLCGGKERYNDVSACKWDTGGPYVCRSKQGGNWVIQGVVSTGSRRCDPNHKYTVFTRVSKYVSWIKKNTENLVKSP